MRWNLFEAMNSDSRMHDKLEERLEAKKKKKTVISDASGKRAVYHISAGVRVAGKDAQRQRLLLSVPKALLWPSRAWRVQILTRQYLGRLSPVVSEVSKRRKSFCFKI